MSRPRFILHNLIVLATALVLLGATIVLAAGRGSAASLYLITESLPWLAAMWLGAAGLGYPLRAWWLNNARFAGVLQTMLGMTVLLIAGQVMGVMGWLTGPTAWGLCGVGGLLLAVQLARRPKPDAEQRTPWPWSLTLAAPGLGLLLVAATCPPGTLWRVEAFGYDVTTYHLQLPREWIELGRIKGLEHNIYGYLPGLIESAFHQLALMRGSVLDAVYLCQLFVASLAVAAAIAIGCAVATFATPVAGAVAGAVFLNVPWVMITGSMAYNEMGVCALGAAALLMALQPGSERLRGAAAVGVLAGAATLCKLTAGPMIALPLGILMLTRLNHALRWRRPPRWGRAIAATTAFGLAGLVTLSPYFVRNAAWTGNPVFPFAAQHLGLAHWDKELADRWDAATGLKWNDASRTEAIMRQWLVNTGYGAIGGEPTPVETRNIARFTRENGAPILWIAVLLGTLLAALHPATRRAVYPMLVLLGFQLVFWLVCTHLQSRFLIPTLLPACVLVGLGAGRIEARLEHRMWWLMPTFAIVLVILLWQTSFITLLNQTRKVPGEDRRPVNAPVWLMVDALNEGFAEHPINALPPDSKTMLVADVGAILYLKRPVGYHTTFDPNPLGGMIRQAEGDPQAVNALLQDAGYTHVYVGWSELDRLHGTYGFDPDVTPDRIKQFIATGWRPVAPQLYALPRKPKK